MFPAGSVEIESSVKNKPLSDESCDWLKSSTFSENVTKAASRWVPTSTTKKTVHKSHQSNNGREHLRLQINNKALFLEDVSGLKISDGYKLDRSSNREIYRHGCIYEKHISQYKQMTKTTILGSRRLRVCELSDVTVVKPRKAVKRSRYFSKYSQSLTSQPSEPVLSDDSIPPNSLLPINIVLPASSNAEISSSIPGNSLLNWCEQLNRRVYDMPNDLKSWLQLIDIQAKDARFMYLPQTSGVYLKDNDRLLIIQKQISIAERALGSNPGSLNLKLMTLRLNELASELVSQGANGSCSGVLPSSGLMNSEQIGREWAQLVFTYPQVVSVWKGYIAHLMGKFAAPPQSSQTLGAGLFARIDSVYKKALSSLSGIISGRILSHRPKPDTAEQAIDLLADYCHWLVQAGHSERALAIWQAVVEFNCFRPNELLTSPPEHYLLEMELFWSSGQARFGQPGSEHWHAWYRAHRCGGAAGYYGSKRSHVTTVNKSSKTASVQKSTAPKGADVVQEFDPRADVEELRNKWSQVSQSLKDVSNRCEDALIHFSVVESVPDEVCSKLDADILPSVLSSSTAVSDDHWVRPSASVPSLTGRLPMGRSRVTQYRRGRAWVGLERAREAVGWLPADLLRGAGSGTAAKQPPVDEFDEEDEDPDRLVLFDDVKPCLLELRNLASDKMMHSAESDEERRELRSISLQQRLLLLCLEFLGSYQPEVAATHKLASDIRLAHDLSKLGILQRQNLCPPLASHDTLMVAPVVDTAFGDPEQKPSRLRPTTHQDVYLHAKRCILDSALLQAGQISGWPQPVRTQWLTALGHLRFQLVLDRLLTEIACGKLSAKCVTAVWRYSGRSIMALGENQQDLDLWRTYASGLWLAALLMVFKSPASADATCLSMIAEARRIFDTALVSYPIPSTLENVEPTDHTELNDFYRKHLAPRLRLLQRYIDLELAVSPGAGGSGKASPTSESRALHLLVYAGLGGCPPQTVASGDGGDGDVRPSPSSLIRASHAYGKRTEAVWRLLTSFTEETRDSVDKGQRRGLLESLGAAFPLLAYFSFLFDLLTSDNQLNTPDFLDGLLSVLAKIDNLRHSATDSPSPAHTRFSDGEPGQEVRASHQAKFSVVTDSLLPSRSASRYFLVLAIGGVAAFSALRQRNRAPLMSVLMSAYAKHCSDSQGLTVVDTELPIALLFPSQLAYFLPSRVSLDHHYLPLSLANASACQGLLPPLLLSRLTQQLHQFSASISTLAAHRLVTCTVGPRTASADHLGQCLPESIEAGEEVASGAVGLIGDPAAGQLDLLSTSLPLAVELVLLGLELERWTSLLAMAGHQERPGQETVMERRNPTCDRRVRNAFERAVRSAVFSASLLDGASTVDCPQLPIHVALTSATPSLWAGHLRLVVWRAYMAFGWMSADQRDPRQRRQAVKSVFYRAVEDVPWAKVLYTDLVRYCPEDVEEAVDLLTERELRLRTPLEEVDLLLAVKPVATASQN